MERCQVGRSGLCSADIMMRVCRPAPTRSTQCPHNGQNLRIMSRFRLVPYEDFNHYMDCVSGKPLRLAAALAGSQPECHYAAHEEDARTVIAMKESGMRAS